MVTKFKTLDNKIWNTSIFLVLKPAALGHCITANGIKLIRNVGKYLPIYKKSLLRNFNHHHYKHPGLGYSARSVSRVTVALSIVPSVSQLFSFLVGCSGMILKGFGFVVFFAGVKDSSFCIHLSCLVCCLSVARGEWSRLFCGHKGRNLPEVSITLFLPPQFFFSVRLSKSNFLTHTKM
jgi:hypothetical protein